MVLKWLGYNSTLWSGPGPGCGDLQYDWTVLSSALSAVTGYDLPN